MLESCASVVQLPCCVTGLLVTGVQGKLARFLDDRYLSAEDTTFVENVESDLEEFIRFKNTKNRVLLFPPVNNYLRLLIHKTVEDFGLHSFSVGEGSGRRTVVCWKEALISDSGASMSVYRPPMMRGRGRGHHRDSNSPNTGNGPLQKVADVGTCISSDRWSHDKFHTAAYTETDNESRSVERNSPVNRAVRDNLSFNKPKPTSDLSNVKSPTENSKPTDRPRSRNKRPDIQVYVPRARRSQNNKANTGSVDDRNTQTLSNNSSTSKMSSVHSPTHSTTSEFSSPNQEVIHVMSNKNSFVISATNTQNDKQLQIHKKLKTSDERKENIDLVPSDNTKADLPSTQNISGSAISVATPCNDKDETNTNCGQIGDFRDPRFGLEGDYSDCSDKAKHSESYGQYKEFRGLSLPEHSQSCLTSNAIHNENQASDQLDCAEDLEQKIFTLDHISNESTTREENRPSANWGNNSAGINQFDEIKLISKSEHFQMSSLQSNSALERSKTHIESSAILTNTNETSKSGVLKALDSVNNDDDDETTYKNSSNCKTETDFPVIYTDVTNKPQDNMSDTDSGALNLSSEVQDIDLRVGDEKTAIEESEVTGNSVQRQDMGISVTKPDNIYGSLETDTGAKPAKNLTCSNFSLISEKCNVETHVKKLNENKEIKELISHDTETEVKSIPDGDEAKEKQIDVFKDKSEITEVITGIIDDSPIETESNMKAIKTNIETVDKESMKDNGMEVEAEEDTWDSMFNEEGDCLDPSAMEELTKTVGKVKIQKSKKINYLDYQPKDKAEMDYNEYGHIIEIYDFPAEFVTRDLITAFQSFLSRGFDLKWVDDTHALGIFGSAIAAQDAAGLIHPLIKVRPLSQASQQSRNKARRCSEFLQPYKARPETSASAARRLVAGALGIATNVSKEKREREKKQLKEAKEKRRKDRQDREDIWEYGKCAMDEES